MEKERKGKRIWIGDNQSSEIQYKTKNNTHHINISSNPDPTASGRNFNTGRTEGLLVTTTTRSSDEISVTD